MNFVSRQIPIFCVKNIFLPAMNSALRRRERRTGASSYRVRLQCTSRYILTMSLVPRQIAVSV